MTYYQGDYYRGDFWSKLGKGIKRVGRDIGRVAKTVAPIATILLPTVGAATLVGRGVAAARRVKAAGRQARAVAGMVTGAPGSSPAEQAMPRTALAATIPSGYTRATSYTPRRGSREGSMSQPENVAWTRGGFREDASGWPLIPTTQRKRQARRAYRRRKATRSTRRRSTRRRSSRSR